MDYPKTDSLAQIHGPLLAFADVVDEIKVDHN